MRVRQKGLVRAIHLDDPANLQPLRKATLPGGRQDVIALREDGGGGYQDTMLYAAIMPQNIAITTSAIAIEQHQPSIRSPR
jgi:hypothetical protein